LALTLWLSSIVNAQNENKPPVFSNEQGAIKGYDPVAYFTKGKPVKGLNSNRFEWKGALWHFETAENKALFAQNPEKYAPQYGGYCAYGWTKGYAAKTEPDAWTIVDGILYLNYDKSIQSKWEKNIPNNIQQANENYQKTQVGRN
jgi:YHS domain-containing protein